jgi:Excalibur calcium-binding domain
MSRRQRTITWFAVVLTASGLSCAPVMAFDCVELTCPKIKTCAEARYKLEVCGHRERDADNDGIPCEDLCGKTKEVYNARSAVGWPDGKDAAAKADPMPSSGAPGANQVLGIVPDGAILSDAPADSGFACSGKRTCKQMVSCAEARFYLTVCKVASLDGDRDGRPCNSLCR